jgi:chromate transporter
MSHIELIDWVTLLLGAVSTLLLFRYKINSVWLILGGAAVGLIFRLLGGH